MVLVVTPLNYLNLLFLICIIIPRLISELFAHMELISLSINLALAELHKASLHIQSLSLHKYLFNFGKEFCMSIRLIIIHQRKMQDSHYKVKYILPCYIPISMEA